MRLVPVLVVAFAVILGAPAATCVPAAAEAVHAPLSLTPDAVKSAKPKKPKRAKTVRRKPIVKHVQRRQPAATAASRDTVGEDRVEESSRVEASSRGKGPDAASIAVLPWWRIDAGSAIRERAVASPVLTAADAWRVSALSAEPEPEATEGYAQGTREEAMAGDETASPAETQQLSSFDRSAGSQPWQRPAWLFSALAMLGGALAAMLVGRRLFA